MRTVIWLCGPDNGCVRRRKTDSARPKEMKSISDSRKEFSVFDWFCGDRYCESCCLLLFFSIHEHTQIFSLISHIVLLFSWIFFVVCLVSFIFICDPFCQASFVFRAVTSIPRMCVVSLRCKHIDTIANNREKKSTTIASYFMSNIPFRFSIQNYFSDKCRIKPACFLLYAILLPATYCSLDRCIQYRIRVESIFVWFHKGRIELCIVWACFRRQYFVCPTLCVTLHYLEFDSLIKSAS